LGPPVEVMSHCRS